MFGVQVLVTAEPEPRLRIRGSVNSWSEPMIVKSSTITREERIRGA